MMFGGGAEGERGSVFVESIIASAIVAMALGATFRVIADSSARDRGIEARRTALLVAQSELDAVGAEIPVAPGRTAGIAGDMVWRVEIAQYPNGGDANPAGALFRVVVGVRPRSGGPELAVLQSLRLGRET